jgi:hypothetical protein
MAEIVIVADLPIESADEVDVTELALLLRDIKAAQIIDFIDSSSIQMTMNEQFTQPGYDEQEYSEG